MMKKVAIFIGALAVIVAGAFAMQSILSIQKSKTGFKSNIEEDVRENKNFRKVVYTGQHIQLVLMSLKSGEEIGSEIHPETDQFFRFESGHGKCVIEGDEYSLKSGDAVIVPAGARHNIINTDPKEDLKLYTLYAPPHHKSGTIQATKKDAGISRANY